VIVAGQARTGIEALLPDGVHAAEARDDLAQAPLYPVERRLIERAVTKRREEFATGRTCARAALAGLGVEPQPIPADPRGAPIWPAGVVGSITHCEGFRACAVAWRRRYAGLGIDAEPNRDLPAGLLDDIALPAEVSWIAGARARDRSISWDRLLFCIKESVYKVWSPITHANLGFGEVRVSPDLADGTFRASVAKSAGSPALLPREIDGTWRHLDGLLLAAVAIAAPGGSGGASR
jgi:4'-phosphopantetheinyl transferase EntD